LLSAPSWKEGATGSTASRIHEHANETRKKARVGAVESVTEA
jgi:hypothetical protein